MLPRRKKHTISEKFWEESNSAANGLAVIDELSGRAKSQRPRTALTEDRTIYSQQEYFREKEILERGIRANEFKQPYKFLSSVGGSAFHRDEENKQKRLKGDNHELRSRETVKDIQTRAVSAMNTVNIDNAIDSKLYQFGAKSASTNEIEQKIKSHNYILGLQRGLGTNEREKIYEKFAPRPLDKNTRPYTASALLNDKPQFRIMTPNLLGGRNKQSLGDLLSDDQYRFELNQLNVVEDISEDQNDLDRFVSANTQMARQGSNHPTVHSAVVSKRPFTSTAALRSQGQARPQSSLSVKRPISGHSQLRTEQFFTNYNKELINIGEDIPYEELFDRNERTICATFAKFGDLSYHTPNYRIGNYMQFPAKLKLKHLLDVVALQNAITSVEKNEFEIPIQLSVIDEMNVGQKKVKTGISSVFKKEEVEREPVTVSLFPEYFEESEGEDDVEERDTNREALKYLEKHLKKMGGHYDPEKIGLDDYLYIPAETLPHEMLVTLKLSYKRFDRYLNDDKFIQNDEIARFKKEWISNAIARVPEQLLRKDEELIRILFQEIFADYRMAIKRSIMNYVLLSSEERKRLSIHLLLRESPTSADRIVKSGAFSILLYHDWHGYVDTARNYLQNNLYSMNIVNSSLINWNEDFKSIKLVETEIIEHMSVLGKSMSPLAFMKIQRLYRDKIQAFMKHVWLKGAILIMKKFKYIRIHKQKKGCWGLLGFSRDPIDTKGFLNTSIESISAKVSEQTEDSADAVFNVINTRINNAIVNLKLLDVPFDKWGEIEFGDLLDIRNCSAYQYYSLYNKEPLMLDKNGYKLLSPEVRLKLRTSVGVLLALKLREKIEESLQIFEDMVLKLPLFSAVCEKLRFKDSYQQEDPSQEEGAASIDQNVIIPSAAEIKRPNSNLFKKKGDQLEAPSIPLMIQHGRVIGPQFDFTEIKNLVEPIDVFFLTFRFANLDFLKYQSNFRPFLMLEMVIENDIIRFSDSDEVIRAFFLKMHGEIVDIFNYFPHPEFLSISLREDPLDSHPTECFPSDNNYEGFFKKFMPKIELKEKKRKRKVQSILESAQVEEVDEKTKTLNVNESGEQQYIESCQKIVDRVVQHYNECKISYSLFGQFGFVSDKSLEKYVKAFTSKNHIALEEFRKCLLIVRAYKNLLEDVPDAVYFPLFEVRTQHVKDHIRAIIVELEKLIVNRVKDYLQSEYGRIKSDFQLLRDTMSKPIENATQYQLMDIFMTGLTQEKIQLRNRSHDIYKKMLFCSKLYIMDGDLLSRAKEVHDCPAQLDNTITMSTVKQNDYKSKIIRDLEIKTANFLETMKDVNEGLVELQGITSFDQFQSNNLKVKKLDSKLMVVEEDRKDINDQEQKLFGKQTDYKQVVEIRKRLQPVQELWESVSQFMNITNDIYNRRVFEVGMAELDDAISDAERSYNRLKITFAKAKDELKVVEQLDKRVQQLKEQYNEIALVCNKGLAERHWDQIKQVMNNPGFNFKEDMLKDLLENPEMVRHLDSIAEISRQASTEYKLQQMLMNIQNAWKERRFELLSWKNTNILIFAGVNFEEIQMLLDDNVLRIQTIRSDPGVKFIEEQAAEWEDLLMFMQEACEIWVKVQQSFVYLVPVFNSEDIRTHMAKAAFEFKKIEGVWEDLMKQVAENPSATAIKQIPNLIQRLKDSQSTMEYILKELDDYLDMKRTKFSRFYFLSNEEMLSILSETKDPQLVQPHLKKCFEGINELVFTIENDITGMKSEMGEVIDFEMKIIPKNYKSAVEEWLVKIEEQMRISMRAKSEECLIDLAQYKNSRQQWLKSWPGQCILLCSQLSWTMLVEDRLKLIKMMKDLKDDMTSQLEEIVKMIRGELSQVERMTLNSLITLEVHNLDIVQELVTNRCNNPTDFDWLSQLRYYVNQSGDKSVSVQMVMTKIDYAFEYLGNTARLVITPLTDRCYRTLMSALFLNLGGAPEGPAGTGKTETTKDLAKAVAVQCVVHNCTGAMNAGSMAKFFKGLVSSGAWSCFDEFNRIQLEVLSVIAQQIHQIQTAKSLKAKEFRFDGSNLKLKDSCNIFITMNPGYAGRSELPDNLKSLFRPVAMMVPDYTTIAEISLYSTGFIDARKLSKKIVSTYKLCSEQLSSQYHYDYGMRTVKSVLVTAAMLKRIMKDSTEDDIILLSIKDVNLPKFVNQDIDIFKAILQDLFPTNTLDTKENPRIDEMLVKSIRSMKLIPHSNFKTKVYQLNEMIKTRHGLMLVGDAMAGKSSVYKVLAKTLNTLNEEGDDELKVNYFIMNPKSVTINDLYGVSDTISQEWFEGILSSAFKQSSRRSKTREWLVLDGPVDAEWIENMNTVLDDNKSLCLMSGDKIPMSKYMTMLFETENLAKASPATVSRCGMIYLNYDLIGIRSLFIKWVLLNLETIFDAEIREHLMDLFDALFRPSVKFIETSKKQYQSMSDMMLTQSFLNFFKSLLIEASLINNKVLEYEAVKLKSRLNILFVQAIAWSLGMTVFNTFRKDFDKFLRRIVSESVKSEIKADRIIKFDKDIVPPEFNGSMMVDYQLNFELWTWSAIRDQIQEFDNQNLLELFRSYHEICIETEETLKIRKM